MLFFTPFLMGLLMLVPNVTKNYSARFANNMPDYVSVPHSSAFAVGTSGLTLSAWMYTHNQLQQQTIIETFLPSDGIHVNQAGFQFNFCGQKSINEVAFSGVIKQKLFLYVGQDLSNSFEWGDTATSLVSNQWYHVGVTYQSGTLKFYVNGALSSTTTSSTLPSLSVGDSGSTLSMGASPDNGIWGDNYPWNGYLTQQTVWNTVFTDSQMARLYNSGRPPNILTAFDASELTHLLAWWKLGNGDTNTSFADSSGNGHNGTVPAFGFMFVESFYP